MQSEWQLFREELPPALAVIMGIVLVAAVGGYLISLPHHGDWLVDGWIRYTLWLMVGIPVVGCMVGALIRDITQEEGPWSALVSMGTWIFWTLSVALLIGFLVTQPHVDPHWIKQWLVGTLCVFLVAIFLAVLPGASSD
jgi:drug/metabolite transporter (DMT)-like permease